MDASALVRYLHFLGILLLFGTLLVENVLVRPEMKRRDLGLLGWVDLAYGLSGMLAIGMGLLLWFVYGKGAEFYLRNPVFHAKLGIVIAVALLSIWPTIFFLKARKGPPEETIPLPASLRLMVRAGLAGGLVIPLLAVLMARGVGLP